MSEDSIVAIIIAFITSGALASLWEGRRRRKRADPPVTTADAEASAAHQSQQLVLASLNAMGAALVSTQQELAQEQERTTGLQGEVRTERTERLRLGQAVEQLRAAHDRDGAMIRTLTAWVRDVHARWPVLRLSETPPPLPQIDHQPPESPGASS